MALLALSTVLYNMSVNMRVYVYFSSARDYLHDLDDGHESARLRQAGER